MRILKDILKESEQYYLDIQKKIRQKIAKLSRGSVKERVLSGKKYYYLQVREGKRVLHKYLGKNKPEELIKEIAQRSNLKQELKKVDGALKLLRKTKGRGRGKGN